MWRFTKNNGITEGFHRKMKLIQRRAYGYRNFKNYRLRVLVECGVKLWKTNLKNQPIPQPLVLTQCSPAGIRTPTRWTKIICATITPPGNLNTINGDDRVRTDDPHNAIVVLFQLSYIPVKLFFDYDIYSPHSQFYFLFFFKFLVETFNARIHFISWLRANTSA